MVQLPAAKDDLEETVTKTDSGDDANLEVNQVAKVSLQRRIFRKPTVRASVRTRPDHQIETAAHISRLTFDQ